MDAPKFIKLKQIYNERPGETPVDSRNLEAARYAKEQALRQSLGITEDPYTEGDQGIEEPFLAPDDLLGPGELKAVGAMSKGLLPLAAGIVNKRGMLTRIGQGLELKEGETLKDVIQKAISKNPDSVTLAGAGVIDSAGKTASEAIRGLRDKASGLGVEIVDSFKGLPKSSQKLTKGAGGIYLPNEKRIHLNEDVIRDPYTKAGIIEHELEHRADQLGKGFPKDFTNYRDIDPTKIDKLKQMLGSEAPEVYDNLLAKAEDLANSGKTEEAEAVLNILKERHFNKYKNFELEKAIKPVAQAMDEFTPEEFEVLKNYPSLLKKK